MISSLRPRGAFWRRVWWQQRKHWQQANRRALKKLFIGGIISLVAFNLDWWTKDWAYKWAKNHPDTHWLIPNFVGVHYEPNPWAASGLKLSFPVICAVSLLVIGVVVVWFWAVRLQFNSGMLALLATGATSNLLTRVWTDTPPHSEIDFLLLSWNGGVSTDYNLADCFVLLAICWLFISTARVMLRGHRRGRAPTKQQLVTPRPGGSGRLRVPPTCANQRLDVALTRLLQPQFNFSRQVVLRAIKQGFVTVNGRVRPPSHVVRDADQLTWRVAVPRPAAASPTPLSQLTVIYEDAALAVIDKPNHLVSHPTPHHPTPTLVDYLQRQIRPLAPDPVRPGIVHRLDQATTGLMLIAKTRAVAQQLQQQLQRHDVVRTYLAIVHGVVQPATGTINAAIGKRFTPRPTMTIDVVTGKPATTHFRVLRRGSHHTLLSCQLASGRTHQIRLHCRHIGHPVVGDHRYGLASDRQLAFGQYLHAWKLMFLHPTTNTVLRLKSSPPRAFKNMLKQLKLGGEMVKDDGLSTPTTVI